MLMRLTPEGRVLNWAWARMYAEYQKLLLLRTAANGFTCGDLQATSVYMVSLYYWVHV